MVGDGTLKGSPGGSAGSWLSPGLASLLIPRGAWHGGRRCLV